MTGHVPVMLDEVCEALAPRDGGLYLDGTFGGGGYARAILDAARCTLFAIDRDPHAIARGAALAAAMAGRLHLIEGSFGDMLSLLAGRGVAALDGIVLDLGVSSFQIDTPERGFSFRSDGPLDMRMSLSGMTAADLVADLDEADLADIIFRFGEDRHARRIARAIVAARDAAPITTTAGLAAIVRAAVPPSRDGIDPATCTFQALRIVVNDELGEITRALAQALDLLAPSGRLVVVSFHSLEDRLVKGAFQAASGTAPGLSRHDPRALLAGRAAPAAPGFSLLTRRALRPSEAECARNPRARSARLRAIMRNAQTDHLAAGAAITVAAGAA